MRELLMNASSFEGRPRRSIERDSRLETPFAGQHGKTAKSKNAVRLTMLPFAQPPAAAIHSPPVKFFDPNIGRTGRIVRAVYGVILIGAGLWLGSYSLWICLALVAAGALGLFEAFRGWCIMRACGIKTRL